MILYHGTSGGLGESILKSGYLSTKAKRIYDETLNINVGDINTSTTPGYVYLTDKLICALCYANSAAFIQKDGYICIFQIEFPIDFLQIDEDQLILNNRKLCQTSNNKDVTSVQQSLDILHSVRTDKDIFFDSCKMSFVKAVSTSYATSETIIEKLKMSNIHRLIHAITHRNLWHKEQECIDMFNSAYEWKEWE